MRDALSIFFMISGTFFMVTATIGMIRMPDFYTRMHALTKAATLGIAGILMASIFEFWSATVTVKVLLAILFHFISNPVGAHMISRAAYHHLKVNFWKNTVSKEWEESIRDWGMKS